MDAYKPTLVLPSRFDRRQAGRLHSRNTTWTRSHRRKELVHRRETLLATYDSSRVKSIAGRFLTILCYVGEEEGFVGTVWELHSESRFAP
jgi:hypothetical protein